MIGDPDNLGGGMVAPPTQGRVTQLLADFFGPANRATG